MDVSILNEMKQNSGLQLKESEISQVKTMNAEARLIGAFGSLMRELNWVKRDAESNIGMRARMGMGCNVSMEDSEASKDVNKAKLFKVAMEKLAIVEAEIKKNFSEDVKITIVKVEKDEDDGEETEG